MFFTKKRDNKKNIIIIFVAILFCLCNNNKQAEAELSYNFTTKQITNGLSSKESKQKLQNNANEDDDIRYYYNLNNERNSQTNNYSNNKISEEKVKPTGDKNNEVKLNIGGLVEAQYLYVKQSSEYEADILPNGLPQSPAEIKNYSVVNGQNHVINVLGKIDVNPEFVHYKETDRGRKKIITVGAKISQPFYNASKNTFPQLAPQEYIYVKTPYLQFQIGAVNSSASKMRVDAQKTASGAGGVYGAWWRYVSLPVFNTSGLSIQDANVLNAMSPVYILYPTLPNEAGFTTQRTSIGRSLSGNITIDNLSNGSRAQGYPTQGAYSNKISFYTKRIKGFSFGLSYSSTTANTGFITRELNRGTHTFTNISGGFVKNYTSVALDYRQQFDRYGLGVAMSLTYEYGEASPLKYYNNNGGVYSSIVLSNSPYYKRHNLNAFAVGLQVVYKNYSFAYSYGHWGHSLLNKYLIMEDGKYQVANQNKRSYYHTAGIGANYGPVRIGVTYMRSSFSGYKLDAWSIGTDYKMISLKYLRIQPYFEYLGYIFHTQNIQLKAGENMTYKASASKGFILTLGMRVVF